MVHSGVDEADVATVKEQPTVPAGIALAFAHHSNKQPELAIKAWGELLRRGVASPSLAIVGADPAAAEGLHRLASAEGIPPSIYSISGVLDDRKYAALWSRVSMVVLPSAFEGFGLPVLEALARGLPAIVSADEALREVGSSHVFVATRDDPGAYAEQVILAIEVEDEQLQAARMAHAMTFPWAFTAAGLQNVIKELWRGPSSIASDY
jgi:glycosyltransferase involved in cell wall biosynthesis